MCAGCFVDPDAFDCNCYATKQRFCGYIPQSCTLCSLPCPISKVPATHTRTHARAHASTHTRTLARTHTHTYAPMHLCIYARTHCSNEHARKRMRPGKNWTVCQQVSAHECTHVCDHVRGKGPLNKVSCAHVLDTCCSDDLLHPGIMA